MISSAGDVSLDRGAWGTLTFGPAPQLPQQFTGDYILMRDFSTTTRTERFRVSFSEISRRKREIPTRLKLCTRQSSLL